MSQEEQLRDLDRKINEANIKTALSVQTIERLDKTVQQLSIIAADLSKLLAVHEKRIDILEDVNKISGEDRERRRLEVDTKMDNISHLIKKSEDELNNSIEKNKIIQDSTIEKIRSEYVIQLDKIRNEHRLEIEKIDKKVATLQKFAWGAIGMGTILGILISQAANIARLIIGT